MDSDNLLQRIREYLILVLAFNTARDELVWKYIVVVAAQLEHLAITALWVSQGRQPPFWEYAEKLTLGGAVTELDRRRLFPSAIIDKLRAIARLRNSVVHNLIIRGVTEVAEYNGQKVFHDNDAFEQLVKDAEHVIGELRTYFKQHCPDLLPGQS